ncbi:MAG: nucleoside triphosphate pyrophosphohydrolase [Pontixanthobacter sp.]
MESLNRLLSIMKRLRDPDTGCEWDRAQSFKSIAPYTIEEAYEVADAIDLGDMTELRGELGDLLLQVVFHAQMASEQGSFDFEAVATTIADKMEARHPHIFGSEDGLMTGSRWEDIKQTERQKKGATSALDGVANALPALMRAEKLQKRASRVGFDWPDIAGPRAKVLEELSELEAAEHAQQAEEAGDLLFAVANLVRAYGLSPETVLKKANAKFERRFKSMENMADGNFHRLDIDQQEKLWDAVKSSEKAN